MIHYPYLLAHTPLFVLVFTSFLSSNHSRILTFSSFFFFLSRFTALISVLLSGDMASARASGVAAEGLKLASFNVNGLNMPTKRRAIFEQLREVSANISFIQESHSTESFKDPQGRVILLDIEIHGEQFTLGSIYAPTQDRPDEQMSFLDTLQEGLESMTNVNVLLAGDFNCVLDPNLDKNSSASTPPNTNSYRNGLRAFMEDAMFISCCAMCGETGTWLRLLIPSEEQNMPPGWISF